MKYITSLTDNLTYRETNVAKWVLDNMMKSHKYEFRFAIEQGAKDTFTCNQTVINTLRKLEIAEAIHYRGKKQKNVTVSRFMRETFNELIKALEVR